MSRPVEEPSSNSYMCLIFGARYNSKAARDTGSHLDCKTSFSLRSFSRTFNFFKEFVSHIQQALFKKFLHSTVLYLKRGIDEYSQRQRISTELAYQMIFLVSPSQNVHEID